MIIKLDIKGYQKYAVANNRVVNRKTQKELRPKIYNGIAYYNLNSKKVRADSLEFERPTNFNCPF
jgi:hypothetical protein